MVDEIEKIVKEFEENAVEAKEFNRITEEIKKEEEEECYPHTPGYFARLRRERTQSILSNQSVGSNLYW